MQSEERSVDDLQDVQGEADARGISIDRVGIKGLRMPVQVRERGGGVQSSVATISLTVQLPADQKGTHMSRFVELLHEDRRALDEFVVGELLAELCRRLNAQAATADFRFPFFTEKRSPVSQSQGLMDYDVVVLGTAGPTGLVVTKTVVVPVTTLCPCSKAISVHGAHNQRGAVHFSVRSSRALPLEELIEMAEACASSELYSVLKRADEKAVTERAFLHPVFVEDLVRNLALLAGAHPDIRWYRIEAENFESIHNHNAYAELERTQS